MSNDNDLGARLRAALGAQAQPVTGSAGLEDRIIAAAMAPAAGSPRGGLVSWRRWVLPVASAAAVIVLVAAGLITANLLSSDNGSGGNGAPPVASGPSSSVTTSASHPSPSATGSASPTVTAPLQPAGGPVPDGFHAVDLTWITPDVGWALGAAPCQHAPCTSMVRTTDGGKTWVGVPAPTAELSQSDSCTTGCVSSIRFANAEVGYVFGHTALYLTTDGGAHWNKQDGNGADGLEISDGNVLRIEATQPGGCPPGCAYQLQRAKVGSGDWQDVSAPGLPTGAGAQLVRAGADVAILITQHVAGGAGKATSTLLVSTDDGANWTSRGEVCPQASGQQGEVDSAQVAMGPDGSLAVLCVPRTGTGTATVLAAADPNGAFTPASGAKVSTTAIGATSATSLFAVSDAVYRWQGSAGPAWQRVLADPTLAASGSTGASGARPYLGFENASTGRYISGDGHTIYTTTDGGAHWSAHAFK